eukprot:Skav233989  [mRNA]  locus=scaffold1008:925402:928009:+ [translate_table: standard]
MAPKFDPNEVKVVFLRQYGGEQAPSSVLAPKEFKGTAKEILGTCFAVGCTVDGQKPGALQQALMGMDGWTLN